MTYMNTSRNSIHTVIFNVSVYICPTFGVMVGINMCVKIHYYCTIWSFQIFPIVFSTSAWITMEIPTCSCFVKLTLIKIRFIREAWNFITHFNQPPY